MTEYRVKGALFENIKDSGPAFTGFVEIDGVKTSLALWPKTSAKGDRYLQVSEDKKKKTNPAPSANSPFKPRTGNNPAKTSIARGNDPRDDFEDDSDIPF